MTDDLAVAVLARLVLRALTVIAARMRHHHWIVVRFVPPAAVAEILGQLVLSVSVVAIGTGPGVERGQASCSFLGIREVVFIY